MSNLEDIQQSIEIMKQQIALIMKTIGLTTHDTNSSNDPLLGDSFDMLSYINSKRNMQMDQKLKNQINKIKQLESQPKNMSETTLKDLTPKSNKDEKKEEKREEKKEEKREKEEKIYINPLMKYQPKKQKEILQKIFNNAKSRVSEDAENRQEKIKEEADRLLQIWINSEKSIQ